jgi:leucyl-tRNA synthetase
LGGIAGIRRFLERVYALSDSEFIETTPTETLQLLHQTIEKVSSDISAYKFNTALSTLMIFINAAEKTSISKTDYEVFLKLIAPFAPHLAEELWATLGHTTSIHSEMWPKSDTSLAQKNTFTIGVQINGKLRGAIELPRDASESDALLAMENHEHIQKYMNGQTPKKVIYIKNKILNLIIS